MHWQLLYEELKFCKLQNFEESSNLTVLLKLLKLIKVNYSSWLSIPQVNNAVECLSHVFAATMGRA